MIIFLDIDKNLRYNIEKCEIIKEINGGYKDETKIQKNSNQ